jgi:hypothetical protein
LVIHHVVAGLSLQVMTRRIWLSLGRGATNKSYHLLPKATADSYLRYVGTDRSKQ